VCIICASLQQPGSSSSSSPIGMSWTLPATDGGNGLSNRNLPSDALEGELFASRVRPTCSKTTYFGPNPNPPAVCREGGGVLHPKSQPIRSDQEFGVIYEARDGLCSDAILSV